MKNTALVTLVSLSSDIPRLSGQDPEGLFPSVEAEIVSKKLEQIYSTAVFLDRGNPGFLGHTNGALGK